MRSTTSTLAEQGTRRSATHPPTHPPTHPQPPPTRPTPHLHIHRHLSVLLQQHPHPLLLHPLLQAQQHRLHLARALLHPLNPSLQACAGAGRRRRGWRPLARVCARPARARGGGGGAGGAPSRGCVHAPLAPPTHPPTTHPPSPTHQTKPAAPQLGSSPFCAALSTPCVPSASADDALARRSWSDSSSPAAPAVRTMASPTSRATRPSTRKTPAPPRRGPWRSPPPTGSGSPPSGSTLQNSASSSIGKRRQGNLPARRVSVIGPPAVGGHPDSPATPRSPEPDAR